MEIGDVYVRFKTTNATRKELGCISQDLFFYTEEIRVTQFNPNPRIPKGYLKLVRMNTKPILEDGQVLGYKFKIEEGVMKRWYLICSGPDDQQLLVVDDYEEAVQDYIDQCVQQRGYDNVYTCLSYKDDPDPIFSAEAAAVLAWRSQVWRTAQSILNQWMTGQIQQPTIAEVLTQLPTLVWPE